MERYVRFVVRHRLAVLSIIGVMTLATLPVFPLGVIASSPSKLFFGDDPDYARWRQLAREFGNDELIIVAFSDPELFTPAHLERLRRAVSTIEAMPDVERVDSILDADKVWGEGDELDVVPYVDLIAAHPERAAALARELAGDEMYQDLVISADGRTVVVAVELSVVDDRPAEVLPHLVDEVVAAFTAQGFAERELHLAGVSATLSECLDLAYFTFGTISPAVAVILLLVTFLLFRRLWPVTITAVVSGLAVMWTLAFSILLDREINILITAMPGLLMVVAFADVVHLCSAYLFLLRDGTPKDEAVIIAGTDVGRACLLTSLTTFFGFAAMVFVPTPVVRQLGLVLGFGVAVALLLAVTLVPIFLHMLRAPAAETGRRHHGQDLVDWVVETSSAVSRRHPRLIIAAFGLLTLGCLLALTRLEIEIDFNGRLEYDNPIRVAERFYQEHFSGTTPVELFIESDEPGALRSPEAIRKMAAAQEAAEAVAGVDKTMGLADLLRIIHQAMGGSGELPESRALIAQYLLLFELSGGEGVDRLIDPAGQRAHVIMRLDPTAFREVATVARRAEDAARAQLGDAYHVEAISGVSLFGRFGDNVIAGQQRGLVFAFAVIMVLMCLGLRSLRVGLWSMLPNVLPILALGGLLSLLYDKVDTDTMMVAMIAVGIGVDDTIHFLMRYRVEIDRLGDVPKAIASTFRFAGRGIVMTTIILAVGFSPFAASGYYSTWQIGTFLPFALVVAVLADLLLLPALVQVGWLRFK